MSDFFKLADEQSIRSESGVWYRNLQLLGAGGNAVTYLTVATSGANRGGLFAVKVFRRLSKPERRESFLKEVGFLQKCDHPGIMRVFDTGVLYGEHPFFVAEYLPHTLYRVIRVGEASMVVRISYALQLLSALAYLETLEPAVVHRDIKPQNIFVKGRSCVLGDFGLMRHVDSETEEDRLVLKESVGVGMPLRYRTPDLVGYLQGGPRPTPKSDVFQLGLVLAELFTGRNPEKPCADFNDPVELDRLGKVPGALSGMIASVIHRMLVVAPEKRDAGSKFLDPWEGIFKAAAKQAHALEGRAVW